MNWKNLQQQPDLIGGGEPVTPNISTKEIARLLNISGHRVETSRYPQQKTGPYP